MVWPLIMKRAKKPPMQKSMTLAEMRVLLAAKDAQLQKCIEYNTQWQTVAQGFGRQKNELLVIVEQQAHQIEYWKAVVLGAQVKQ